MNEKELINFLKKNLVISISGSYTEVDGKYEEYSVLTSVSIAIYLGDELITSTSLD